jgi:hypothetical protein
VSKERLAKALRAHTSDAIKRHGAHAVVGEVKAVGTSSGGLKVHIPEHDFLLDSDDLIVGQHVAQYDEDYGIKVGDSMVLVPAKNGDYYAVAVLTATTPTRRGADDWLLIGGAGQPSFQNSWVNFGGAFPSARFRKNAEGRVTLSGVVKKSGSWSVPETIFTLPTGFRPDEQLMMGVKCRGATGDENQGRLDIQTGGNVVIVIGGLASPVQYLSLENLSFYVT